MASAEAARELSIDSIAAGGDGVARTGGMVVFVPRSAPGDVLRAEVRSRKRFGRGRIVELVEPGPHRVMPRCAHYVENDCGGCQLQHLDYPAQLAAKSAIVGDAVRRIARRAVENPRVHPSDRPWRYRRKLTLAIRRSGTDIVAGLRPYHDPDAVFNLVDCPITDEVVLGVWRDIIAAADMLPGADELRGAVRVAEDEATFSLTGGTEWAQADRFLDRVPSLRAIWWTPAGGRRRLAAERGSAPAGASFVQVNAGVSAAMRDHVVKLALSLSPRTAVDAYGGSGDFAEALGRAGVRMVAIELDAEAAAVAATRLPAGSTSLAGRVETLLPGHLPADLVILNPPRTGLDSRVTEALSITAGSAPASAIIYVSCDPGTLARDIGRLGGWRIRSMEAFDMFPQTAHVETVCELLPEPQ
jgi:23S rRNA (uracil1939-C5)-methyltransferase